MTTTQTVLLVEVGVLAGVSLLTFLLEAMTWERTPVAAAIGEILTALSPSVSVFTTPPETFNAPAYVVGYPRTVEYDAAAFSIDTATVPVMVAVGPAELASADAMLHAAKVALNADPSLGGVVQHCRVVQQSNWRRLNIAGADVLCCDLVTEIRM